MKTFCLKHLYFMSLFEKNRKEINAVIASCSMSDKERRDIADRLLTLSPKKAGTYMEEFCRRLHTFDTSSSGAHDAKSQNKSIEIKCSRVISEDESSTAISLFDQMVNASRGIINFSEGFSRSFDCNIQQVKPECFDELYYYLIFGDCILSFKANSPLFSITAKEVFSAVLNKAIKKELIDSEYAQLLAQQQPILGLQALSQEFPRISFIKEALLHLNKLGQLRYSAKQHRGNSGEGQFHITNKNLAYHIEDNFIKAYSYTEFKNVLSSLQPITRKAKTSDVSLEEPSETICTNFSHSSVVPFVSKSATSKKIDEKIKDICQHSIDHESTNKVRKKASKM